MIYVYHDEGTSKESLHHTVSTFKQFLGKHCPLRLLNAQEVKSDSWAKNAQLFVLPGGADIPYMRKLSGVGNQKIKEYVATGGAFLGICAGSYYASSYVEFDQNGPLEVVGSRELQFFPGKAIGPILAPYDYHTLSGSRAAIIHTSFPALSSLAVYYNGGGFFENAQQYPNVQVLARYANQLPAIVASSYGQGLALLSAVHFEYDPHNMKVDCPETQAIIHPLYAENEKRHLLVQSLLKILNIL